MSADPTRRLGVLRRHLSIVHHVPGRLRLRVGAGILATPIGVEREAASAWLQAIGGIRSVRVNALAASVIVHYDPHRLAPATWETLLEGTDEEAAALVGFLMSARS